MRNYYSLLTSHSSLQGGAKMNWQQVCEHGALQNLPFKIELDEQGRILMSPVKVYHSAFQGKIGVILDRLSPKGNVLSECAIRTRKGTKVADVAWASAERFKMIIHETECSVSPEICISVLSSANTADEINEKTELYFEKGCKEVWICSKEGIISFHSPEGERDQSMIVPDFPDKIDLFA